MSRDNEFDQNHYPFDENEDEIIGEEGVGEGNDQQPWNRKFAEDENPKTRQFSRANRNKPKQEASTLSKVVLVGVFITVLIPFVLHFIVQANRDKRPVTTTEPVVMNSVTSQEVTTAAPPETTTVQETTVSVSTRPIETTSRELATTQAPPQPVYEEPVYEEPEAAVEPAGGTYTIQAGDTWWNIASRFGIDVYSLASMNGVTIDSAIYPGMEIVVP